ncbi:GNAT family N-acetyltransferase [Bacillus sp. EB106-08-02-XG196]|uniref:GNAT family N-acetyltransferase n=1 Tax=Bacillus sp. EB106-08-02-XG196 TaxID=2737049 RepID=UPI001C4E9BF1|nr:GNAT family N-acetyltransferase [Bacillus sp. EB106-08-02-XG196]
MENKMVELRLLKSETEYKQAIKLADKVFRDEGHISMGAAFPQVFSPELNQSYGAFINNELVSYIGLVPSIIHLGDAEIKAYSIGAVCTHPGHRKKGFASMLLGRIFTHVQRADASILFVSGSLPMYLKAGCSYYGKLFKYEINKGDLLGNEGYLVRELSPFDWFYLRKLLQARPVYVEQSIYDFSVLYKAAGFASILKMEHKILVAQSENDIKGFVVLGVPNSSLGSCDQPAQVIEWGGEPQAIQTILAETFQNGIKSLKCSIPLYEKELNKLLNSLEKTNASYPGTVKITNLDLLLKQAEPFFSGKVKIVEVDKSSKKLIFNQKSMILDNASLEKLILQGNPTLGSYLNEIFPIPLPFPEGLNYV